MLQVPVVVDVEPEKAGEAVVVDEEDRRIVGILRAEKERICVPGPGLVPVVLHLVSKGVKHLATDDVAVSDATVTLTVASALVGRVGIEPTTT